MDVHQSPIFFQRGIQAVLSQPMDWNMDQKPGVDIQAVGQQMLNIVNLVNYLDPTANLPVEALQRAADGQTQQPQMPQMMGQPQAQPQAQPQEAPQGEPQQVSPEQQAADDAPAQEPANPNDKQK